MTQLTITPKVSDKMARFNGAVAAGEHVAVTIKGGAAWLGEDDGANLTLRVLDLVTGRTLAVFPRPQETMEDGATLDAWRASTDDANDLYCELNLNTTRMLAAARHMLRVPVLFVLGDTDSPRTLYFRDRYEIEYWPERIGDTVPYDLDKWPKQIDEWTELVAGFGETLTEHIGDAEKHITALERSTWNGKYAKPVGGIPGNDLADEVKSVLAAVPGKADKDTTYTKTEVDSLVSGAASGVFVVADSLPAIGEANKIYLVPNGSGTSGNVRDEYMWVNGAWELIGSTQVDLSDYYNKQAADLRFVQKETGKGLFSGSYNDLTDKPAPVAPSTAPAAAGKAADAKATGDALAGKLSRAEAEAGYTDWEVESIASGYQYVSCAWIDQPGIWEITLTDTRSPSVPTIHLAVNAPVYATVLTSPQITLSRVSLRPRRTSELENDSGFITSAGIAGKLNGDAAYPGWTSTPPNPYPAGARVFHNGYLYQLGDEYAGTDSEPGVSEEWGSIRLEDVKQDALTPAQMDAANSGATAEKVREWDGYAAQIALKADAADLRYRMVTVDDGQLVDRAWNNVELDPSTTAVTLTLPSAVPRQVDDRYARDLLVSIGISDNRQLPFALTFAAPSGETARFFTDDGTIPQPDSKGEWLYSISEKWDGKFVVSCRKVVEVSQGGV